MSLGTLKQIFSNLLASGFLGEDLTVIWHAGEPLVVPIEYYARAFREINDIVGAGIKITHCFQTNGMLIDDSWCTFFTEHDVEVGVSVDGPEAVHDKYRVTRSGGGTHSQVMAGIRCLRQNKVRFTVITVLTANSLDKAGELYEFYVQEGIESVAFNIEEIEGVNRSSSLAGAESELRYREFIREFWNLNARRKAIPHIREFNHMLDRIISSSEHGSVYNALVEPLAIVIVDYQGNISTFAPEFLGTSNADYDNFIVGNFCTQDLRDVFESDNYKRLSRDIRRGVEICKATCEYFPICGGGSPVNKLCENGSLISGETMYCRLHTKTIADLAIEICQTIASESH